MLTLRNISQGLLLVETIYLSVISFIYLLFICLWGIMPIFYHPQRAYYDFCLSVIPVATIISIFRIMSWLVNDGVIKGKKISLLWWLIASLGLTLATFSLISTHILSKEEIKLIGYPIGFFYTPGVIYIPTFIHLIIEMIRQKRVLASEKSNLS
jgi:hypothetical protein